MFPEMVGQYSFQFKGKMSILAVYFPSHTQAEEIMILGLDRKYEEGAKEGLGSIDPIVSRNEPRLIGRWFRSTFCPCNIPGEESNEEYGDHWDPSGRFGSQ